MPLEIVIHILDTAYDDGDVESNLYLLVNCSLVRKDWSFISQKLLFRHVVLRTQHAYISFQNAVDRSTHRGRMLGDVVLRLRVVLDHNQPHCLSQHSFAHAVTLCPNLSHLDIALFGQGAPGNDIVGSPNVSRMRRTAPCLDDLTLDLLRSGPDISTLRFSNWSDNSFSLTQLLNLWPLLTSLHICGTAPQLPGTVPVPFPCALRELRTNFQTPPSVEFMKWLLHNSSASLRVLELDRPPAPHMLEYLISEHGHSLHTLALPACPSRDGTAALSRCSVLRELRIENAWVAPSVYRALPDTLEHIAFGVNLDTPLHPLLQAIKRSGALETVTIHLWLGGEQHPQLASVKIACALQGVNLRLTHDIRNFRAVVRGGHKSM
ncbi:hypothetical protein B0H21DRAFT_778050 [Amylocystis lapponica]|nr:hypothetical protein B0H21DRAFT_778050 [Amylocystis lapponica]